MRITKKAAVAGVAAAGAVAGGVAVLTDVADAQYIKDHRVFKCPDEVGEQADMIRFEVFDRSAQGWSRCNSRVRVRVKAKYQAPGSGALMFADSGDRFGFADSETPAKVLGACITAVDREGVRIQAHWYDDGRGVVSGCPAVIFG